MRTIIHLLLGIFLGFAFYATQAQEMKHVVFLISEDPDNYEAPRTIPPFAEKLEHEYRIKTTVLLGEGERSAFRFPGFEVVSDADLVVVFCRRVALPAAQLRVLKAYLAAGKPLVGIRTAHHAFSPREQVAEGHEGWPDFPAEVLGCENKGYGPVEAGLDVTTVPSARRHPILKGVKPLKWHSDGSIYHVAVLDDKATVLLKGKLGEKEEPIAWTRTSPSGSRIFYTSLGYPSDFERDQITRLLSNAIFWAMEGE